MDSSRKKLLTFILAMAIIGLVFTCVNAQNQAGGPPGQSGAGMGSGGPGGAGGPGGMPEGGMSGMPPGGPGGGGPGGMGGPGGGSQEITAGIYIDDGAYVKDKSVTTAVSGGKVGDTSTKGVKITSEDKAFSGIYVKGYKSEYTLSDATIDLYGEGGDMMTGIGAAAVAGGGGRFVLRNVKITTNGPSSCTTVSTDNSVLKVYDSTLIANGGQATGGGGNSPLGITGRTRATMTGNNSESYFYNSTIISDGWGALSTDDIRGYVYLEANDCTVKCLNSGYGTYADIAAIVVLNNTNLETATYTGIIASSGKTYLNNVTATSGGNCYMIHNVLDDAAEIGILEIRGGKITTDKAVVLVKSANANIYIEGAELTPKNGVLIRTMVSDDANASKITHAVMGIRAKLKGMDLEGDLIHEDSERTMKATLIDTTLRGAINNVSLSIVARSKWTATADSNVTFIDSSDISKIDALKGVTITAKAGRGCSLSGTYKLASGGALNVSAN